MWDPLRYLVVGKTDYRHGPGGGGSSDEASYVKPKQEEGYTLTANRRGLLAGEEDINVPELI
jgi:hypothetical protein